MRDHIKILGILNIIMGGLSASLGLIVMLVLGGVAGILAMGVGNGSSTDLADGRTAAPWLGLAGLVVAIFLVTLSLPSIIGGWGLLKFKSWSRVLMIILSAFHLLNIPFGTALGIYGLWVLTNEQSRQLLESGGTMPPVGYVMPQTATPYSSTQPPQSF